jgi:hypothetical protein
MAAARVAGNLKSIAATSGTHLSGKQSDQRQPRPLPYPKWTKQLRFRMF